MNRHLMDDMERLDDLHACEWTHRVFDADSQAMRFSTYACKRCQPMIVDLVQRHHPDIELVTVERAKPGAAA